MCKSHAQGLDDAEAAFAMHNTIVAITLLSFQRKTLAQQLTCPQEVAAGEKVVVVHWSGAPPEERGQSVHHFVWYTPELLPGASVGV